MISMLRLDAAHERRRWLSGTGLALVLVALSTSACAEPSGPHPRLFLDDGTLSGLRELAQRGENPVAGAVRRCREVESSPEAFSRDGYMGLDWAQYLQACLIAWKATGRDGAARTATRYFRALLDDLQVVGDGRGGDQAASRDSGFAMRAHGPYTALAYDWLHDAPGVDAALLAQARGRFKAWTDWYVRHGYRARSPGTNYNAGYVFAATLMAVAQGGEAGEDGANLWRHVAEELFAEDLLPAMTRGVLRGGDWAEGWQYGPLSVAEYALAARAVAPYGVDIAPVEPWLRDIVIRHVYGATPAGDRTYAVGDTELESSYLPVRRDTLTAVVAGPASREAKSWAMAELSRLRLLDDRPDFPLFAALAAAARIAPAEYPRAAAPTTYLARGSSVLYARSSWSSDAIWLVTPCAGSIDVDHMHPNAGSFVLSRGDDDLIVDPSPYGTLSSLTSNAPTVESRNLPDEYRPSQAFWGRETGFRWITTPTAGIKAIRCDYADQYRIQDTPSDVSLAYRDLVLVPYADANGGESALLFIRDRMKARDASQSLHLRFRSPSTLAAGPSSAVTTGTVGRSSIHIRRLASSEVKTSARRLDRGSCFTEQFTRGNCDAARFAVSEYAAVLAGPAAQALHLIDAVSVGDRLPEPTRLAASGGDAWSVVRGGTAWVVAAPDSSAAMSYGSPASGALHFLLPLSARGSDKVRVAAVPTADGCRLSVGGAAGVDIRGTPAIFGVDDACRITERGHQR
jgi:hypothetical protein